MRLSVGIILSFILLGTAGCATIEKTTLPATQEAEYKFPAYTLSPPKNQDWRFVDSNKALQSVAFINSKHYGLLYFGLRPVFEDISQEKTEKEIVEYFQNKMLKDYKLSPDVVLTDKSIKNSEDTIDGKVYKVLTLDYSIEKMNYEIIIYYRINEAKDICYTFYIFKNLKNFTDPSWQARLLEDFRQIVGAIQFKNPAPQDMVSLRIDYALDEFNLLVDKRYVKEKLPELKNKYELLIKEIKRAIALKPNNYQAYAVWGEMMLFNKKYEKLGEGFDKEKALEYFQKSLLLRKYYKPVFVLMAEMYKAINEPDKALNNYDMAIKISPNDEDLYYQAGKLLEDENKQPEALKYYKQALRHWGSGVATRDELQAKVKEWEKKMPATAAGKYN